MIEYLARTRPETCASDLRLDLLASGELSHEEQVETHRHLAGCELCASRMAEMNASRMFFAAARPRMRSRARTRSRQNTVERPVRRWWLLVALLGVMVGAAAAGLAIFLFASAESDSSGEGALFELPRGESRLMVFARHGDQVRPVETGDVVAPGDSLAFAISIVVPRHVAVFGVDRALRTSIYFPAGETAARLEPGGEIALPDRALLDEVPGEEVIYGVFCDRSFAVQRVRAALAAAPARPQFPEGCEVERVAIAKQESE